MYHSLLVHSCGLYGRPRTLRQHLPLQSVITSVGSELEPARSLLGFYNSCSYVVAGQIFSLAEIEHLARHSEELHDVSGILHVLLFYDACMASMKDLCEIILHSSLQVLRSQMQKASTRLMTLLVRAATSAWSSCMAGWSTKGWRCQGRDSTMCGILAPAPVLQTSRQSNAGLAPRTFWAWGQWCEHATELERRERERERERERAGAGAKLRERKRAALQKGGAGAQAKGETPFLRPAERNQERHKEGERERERECCPQPWRKKECCSNRKLELNCNSNFLFGGLDRSGINGWSPFHAELGDG